MKVNLHAAVAVMVVLIACAGRGLAQCQTQKLLATDAAPGAGFGAYVAMDGDWVVIAAPTDSEIAQNSGALYMFQRVGSSWVQTQKLKADDPKLGDGLGESAVAISGDVVVAGSYTNTHQGLQAAGAAYVFERSGSVWSQTAKLVAADAGWEYLFGCSVAVSGTRILVGSRGEDHAGYLSGAVYVFDKLGGAWTQTAKLIASNGVSVDNFGNAVALWGDIALIGAPTKNGTAGTSQGAAYLFQRVNGVWGQTQELRASDAASHDLFGDVAALSGSVALVSAVVHHHPGANFSGGVYVFQGNGSSWAEDVELRPGNGNCDGFGDCLALTSEHILVGAIGDYAGAYPRGSAFDYRRVGSTWTQVGKLRRESEPNDIAFGFGLGIAGETAIVGASGDDTACPSDVGCNSGSAFALELAPTAVQYGACASGSPCNNVDQSAGCDNSTGRGAALSACGSGSVALDDLRIGATSCPPNKLTLLFMAPLNAYVPYGDGIRVVKAGGGVGLYRLGGLIANAQGIAMRGPGIVAQTQHLPTPGRIQAGQIWNFQVWYRDSHGPCGTGTNFTNGVQVAFTP